MEHLNGETLARLVDERPEGNEREHLEACLSCRAELEALIGQTRALGDLPHLVPPRGEWETLEARLTREGLLRENTGGSRRLRALPVSPFGGKWRGLAAGLVLFLGGTALGAGATSGGSVGGLASGLFGGGGADEAVSLAQQPASLEAAAEDVRIAEARYVGALDRYRELAEQGGGASYDPISRFAALDALVAASQAAVREAPTDPFLNGMLVSTVAERQATLRRISINDNWY